MSQVFTPNEDATRRIQEAVRTVEGQSPSTIGRRRRPSPAASGPTPYAVLADNPAGDRVPARRAIMDGTTLRPDPAAPVVQIAKPWKLRYSLASYPNLTRFDPILGEFHRVSVAAQVNGVTTAETWEVSPPYLADDIIWATPADTGVPNAPLLDLNADARAWIAIG